MTLRRSLACLLVATGFLSGCAEPPSREMERAQGAIDAARAAGADQYATTEYTAATAALAGANEAVGAGDYRLALNHALESHEHAQNAARDTADTKARMRGDLEREMSHLEALLQKGEAQTATAPRARAARRVPASLTAAMSAAGTSLQEAREAVAAGDYIKATKLLEGVGGSLEQALAAAAQPAPQSSPRRP